MLWLWSNLPELLAAAAWAAAWAADTVWAVAEADVDADDEAGFDDDCRCDDDDLDDLADVPLVDADAPVAPPTAVVVEEVGVAKLRSCGEPRHLSEDTVAYLQLLGADDEPPGERKPIRSQPGLNLVTIQVHRLLINCFIFWGKVRFGPKLIIWTRQKILGDPFPLLRSIYKRNNNIWIFTMKTFTRLNLKNKPRKLSSGEKAITD